MAERERIPNKQRRALARAERKRQAEVARKRAVRRRITSTVSTVLVLGGITALVLTALVGGDAGLDEPVVLAVAEVETARGRAGCQVVADTAVGAPTHMEQGSNPPPSEVQPPTGAAHYASTVPVVRDGSSRQLDTTALGHNLEHGAVAVWYDPAKIDRTTVASIEDWAERRNNAGFIQPMSGVGIFVAPFEDPGIRSGKAVALRSWSLGVDCDSWDDVASDSFVIETYGSRGGAPEGAAFPEAVLSYADGDTPSSWRELPGTSSTESSDIETPATESP